jgi:hypothetical protein
LEHAVDITDDVDPMTLAINQAAEHLRSALHAGHGARVEPLSGSKTRSRRLISGFRPPSRTR